MRAISCLSLDDGISTVSCAAMDAVADPGQEVGDGVGHRHGATSSTSSCRGCSRCARARAGRSGRGRTCGTRRAAGRTCGSACRPASCTSAGALRAILEVLAMNPLFSRRWRARSLRLSKPSRAPVARERHAERVEQGERLGVRLGGGGDRDVEPADLVDAVVVDLGEDDLLADAHGVVAAAVERARVQAAEVADPRDRDRAQAVEELVGALAAQRDGQARPACPRAA